MTFVILVLLPPHQDLPHSLSVDSGIGGLGAAPKLWEAQMDPPAFPPSFKTAGKHILPFFSPFLTLVWNIDYSSAVRARRIYAFLAQLLPV